RTHASRHSTAILDRIGRDLQEAFLIVKPAEVDPLFHPWIFFSEEDGDNDRILFFTRNHQPRGGNPREWDLTKVAYFLAPDEDGVRSLWRWVVPGIPTEHQKDFPYVDDPGVSLVSHDVDELHLEFRSLVGTEWTRGWDSNQLEYTGQLPMAVRIEIAISDPYAADSGKEDPFHRFSRIVQLQIPAFIEEMVFSSPGKEGEEDPICEERGEGLVVDECVDHGHPEYDADPEYIFGNIPKSDCFYNYIGALLEVDEGMIDEYRHQDCGIVMDNWREDQDE
ncbi:MAG: hypothetical protein JRC77_08030, partial [Deltaproteobacteria bacterium]|nr:hypothetical protein [Deltaproteobacteria bacterium]